MAEGFALVRRLFGRAPSPEEARGDSERYDPWDRLVAEAPAGMAAARATVARAAVVAAPGLGDRAGGPVELGAQDAGPVFEAFLDELTAELLKLCAPYDYRQLFLFSRLCINLPTFRSTERNLSRVWMRVQAADLCALGFGSRILGDFTRVDSEAGFSLGHPPDAIAGDTVRLHELARRFRLAVVALTRLNYLRVFAGENGRKHSPTAVLGSDGTLRVIAGSQEAGTAADLFEHRYTYNRALSLWGVAEAEAAGQPVALSYDLSEKVRDEPYGGAPFLAKPLWFNEFFEHGVRFRRRFEDGVGIPVEHLYCITRALYRLGIDRALENDELLAGWADLTGTLPIDRRELLGGTLEEIAEARSGEFSEEYGGPYEGDQSMGRSIERFVELAASHQVPLDALASNEPPGEELMSLRALWPPSMIHGEGRHDVWIVDFASTGGFLQRLADLVDVTERTRTTGSSDHDANVRTSTFDFQLFEQLSRARGVKPASFPDRLKQADLPNIVFRTGGDSGREVAEIDVPVRVGCVLVAVQTWARDVDKRMEAGDYEALKGRWRSVRRKLKKTDEHYARDLIADPEARRYLKRKGIRFVLPVFCSPFSEPVISTDPKYWIRHPSEVPPNELPASLPRVVTPPELGPFLDQTTEEELKRLCEREGWRL